MDENDVFQRNVKNKKSDVVKDPQTLMVGLKKEKEEEKKELTKDEDFNSYEEITEKTKEDFIKRGITSLFPIQYSCFNTVYANEDLIARDLTGSGKTLAFCLPLVERYRKLGYFNATKSYTRNLYAIIMTPTRELAQQVANELKKLQHREHEYKVLTVYGGVHIESQEKELKYGVEFFVGTCGRVLDHISRGNIDFSNLKTVVLDEADQMLNMGFEEDIEAIISKVEEEVTEKPQFLFFSATIPDWFRAAAKRYLNKDYKTVDLVKNLKNKTAHTVNHLALNCPYENNKNSVLADVLRCYGGLKGKSIVFTQTKVEANDIILSEKMRNNAEVLHGDIAQKQREVTLRRFKEGKFNVLVATDVAARGLDIPNVDLVVQLEPPKDIEAYIHRSGRTARAGKDGMCITFYSGRQYNVIQEIGYRAGVKFKKIGPPKNEDVIKVSAADVLDNLRNVDKKVLPIFEEAAEKFIEEVGAKEALCMALAMISDTSKAHLASRSLISGAEGDCTYILKSNKEINSVTYIQRLLQNNFSRDIGTHVKGIRLLKSGDGAVFDISDEVADSLNQEYKQAACSKRGIPFTLEPASELPELDEGRRKMRTPHEGSRRGGYNGGKFGRNGGYFNEDESSGHYYGKSTRGMTSRNRGGRRGGFNGRGRNDFETRSINSEMGFYGKKEHFGRNGPSDFKSGKGTFGKKEDSDFQFKSSGGPPRFHGKAQKKT